MLPFPLAGADALITVNTLNNQNDFVEFTVTNICKIECVKIVGVHVEKEEGGRWKIVRWHLGCPCDAKCKMAKIELGVNESRKYVWDKKDQSCNILSKGKYRFKITGDWNDTTRKIDVVAMSGEFILP